MARDYTATTTANVISTAGDAALSVTDPSATAPGRLVNGAFALPQALQARIAPSGVFGALSGTPLALQTYTGADQQRRCDRRLPAVDRGHRPAAHRRLREDGVFTLSTTSP